MTSNSVLNFVIGKNENCFFASLSHFQPVIRLASSGYSADSQALDFDLRGTAGRVHRFTLLRWGDGYEHRTAVPAQSWKENCSFKIVPGVRRRRDSVVVQRDVGNLVQLFVYVPNFNRYRH